MGYVKKVGFLEVSQIIDKMTDKDVFLSFFNFSSVTKEEEVEFKSFLKANSESLTRQGVATMIELLGRIELFISKNRIIMTEKPAYSTVQGIEAIAWDVNKKSFIFFEAKSTDVTEKNIIDAHNKIVEAEEDISDLSSSRVKRQNINNLRGLAVSRTRAEFMGLDKNAINDVVEQLEEASQGSPKWVAISAGYNGKDDECLKHKRYFAQENVAVKMHASEFQEIYKKIFLKIGGKYD